MMLDADLVAVSPSSVWRGLGQAGLLRKWKGNPELYVEDSATVLAGYAGGSCGGSKSATGGVYEEPAHQWVGQSGVGHSEAVVPECLARYFDARGECRIGVGSSGRFHFGES